ncbi:class I SAM-dependent methyltransferase [Neorhodopirellula lusitana]|uniref:class I SAM-dependent methyltransferase n=1 Tax=Neorhodopirellula lusitana TaxID=445327 RepID=UPI00384B497C
MNRIAEKDPVAATGCPEEKMFQLNYLIENGMQPHHRFLDFGCGTGSAAVNFVRYLEPQNYTGIDIASECIRIAQKRIADHDLLDQQPNFHWINGDAAGPLQDQKFDVIWAQSVLTHMPPEDISSLLQTVEKFMHSESRFFATFAHTPAEPRHHRYKDWYYNAEFFSELTENSPLSCRIMDTWAHPNSSIDRMLCFERRHNEQAEAA